MNGDSGSKAGMTEGNRHSGLDPESQLPTPPTESLLRVPLKGRYNTTMVAAISAKKQTFPHRTQNTEHRTQNTEHRTQNTEHRNCAPALYFVNPLIDSFSFLYPYRIRLGVKKRIGI